MTNSKVHLYSFLRHLVEKNYSKAGNHLEQVVEEKLRDRAKQAKAKMTGKSQTKAPQAKATSKMTAKKDSPKGEKE
jgi:hypothetical protein